MISRHLREKYKNACILSRLVRDWQKKTVNDLNITSEISDCVWIALKLRVTGSRGSARTTGLTNRKCYVLWTFPSFLYNGAINMSGTQSNTISSSVAYCSVLSIVSSSDMFLFVQLEPSSGRTSKGIMYSWYAY
jgi:hypothetical protein